MIGQLNTYGPTQHRQWSALAVGLGGLGVCLLAARQEPEIVLRGYLVAWLFVLGLALGALALVMIHHLTGGVWGLVSGRILEAQMMTLPLVALLFLPVALGARHVFPWSGKAAEARTSQVAPKRSQNGFRDKYFQPPLVWGRAAVYFVLWSGLAVFLRRWSRSSNALDGSDETSRARVAWKCQTISGPGLVAYGITLHFAAVDWMMSIRPEFTSTIFGPIVATSQLLSAFALAVIVLAWHSGRPEFDEALSLKALNDVGNLLFTFVIVWAYLAWCQFMLIWIGDLPRDNIWWLERSRGGWQWIACALVGLHFAVPFFLLLFRGVKQNIPWLGGVAGLLLAMHYAFEHYQIVPWFSPDRLTVYWQDGAAALGVGGIWLAAFLWLLKSRPLIQRGGRDWPQAIHLRHLDEEDAAREETIAHV